MMMVAPLMVRRKAMEHRRDQEPRKQKPRRKAQYHSSRGLHPSRLINATALSIRSIALSPDRIKRTFHTIRQETCLTGSPPRKGATENTAARRVIPETAARFLKPNNSAACGVQACVNEAFSSRSPG